MNSPMTPDKQALLDLEGEEEMGSSVAESGSSPSGATEGLSAAGWRETVDRIVPEMEAVDEGQYPAEWSLYTDRTRIRRELLALDLTPRAPHDEGERAPDDPLLQEIIQLREALRPFAEFAENNTAPDESSPGFGIWSGDGCQREPIAVWFGPTNFYRARQALETSNG